VPRCEFFGIVPLAKVADSRNLEKYERKNKDKQLEERFFLYIDILNFSNLIS
jgi:hypothetical protein